MSNTAAGPFSDAGIEVLRNVDMEDVFDTYRSGRTWSTQDGGHLTILDDAGEPVASYTPLAWRSVRKARRA